MCFEDSSGRCQKKRLPVNRMKIGASTGFARIEVLFGDAPAQSES